MVSSPSDERVDLRELASKIGVKIANTTDLVDALRAGKSCLPLTGDGSRKKAWGASKVPSIVDASLPSFTTEVLSPFYRSALFSSAKLLHARGFLE